MPCCPTSLEEDLQGDECLRATSYGFAIQLPARQFLVCNNVACMTWIMATIADRTRQQILVECQVLQITQRPPCKRQCACASRKHHQLQYTAHSCTHLLNIRASRGLSQGA